MPDEATLTVDELVALGQLAGYTASEVASMLLESGGERGRGEMSTATERKQVKDFIGRTIWVHGHRHVHRTLPTPEGQLLIHNHEHTADNPEAHHGTQPLNGTFTPEEAE